MRVSRLTIPLLIPLLGPFPPLPITGLDGSATAPAPPAVEAQMYPIDTAHSAIEFVVRFMGLSKVRGRFADFSGTIMFDAEDPARSTVALIVPVAGIDTDNDFRDRHLKSPDWFDAEAHPLITFQSRRIERRTNDRFVVHGPLTIHGVTKEVAIPITMLHGDSPDAWGNRRIGFEGETTIDRKEYGVEGTNFFNEAFDVARMGVADEVAIELTVSGRILNMDRISFGAAEGKRSVGERMLEVIETRDVDAAIEEYTTLRRDEAAAYDVGEAQLNTLGYKLLRSGRVDAAIEVFELAAAEHPESGNVHDSLGEAYAAAGRREAAIEAYRRALARDPRMTSAIEMLRWLEGRTGAVTLAR